MQNKVSDFILKKTNGVLNVKNTDINYEEIVGLSNNIDGFIIKNKKDYHKRTNIDIDKLKILQIISVDNGWAGAYVVVRENDIIEYIIRGSGRPIMDYKIYKIE